MAKRNLKFPYNKKVVEALASFVATLEREAPERISLGELNYACEDGRIGGLLGIRINIEMSDDEYADLEGCLPRKEAAFTVASKIILSSDAWAAETAFAMISQRLSRVFGRLSVLMISTS